MVHWDKGSTNFINSLQTLLSPFWSWSVLMLLIWSSIALLLSFTRNKRFEEGLKGANSILHKLVEKLGKCISLKVIIGIRFVSGILVNFLRGKSHIKHEMMQAHLVGSKSSYFNVPFQTKPQKHFDDLFLGFPHKTFFRIL